MSDSGKYHEGRMINSNFISSSKQNERTFCIMGHQVNIRCENRT